LSVDDLRTWQGVVLGGERTGKSPALNPAAETGRREMWG
jgi:hypothetical protein